MANHHREKYIGKLLTGISLITSGIFLSMYIVQNQELHAGWYYWALGVAIILNSGLVVLCNAFVHKIKADLIRKQKQRERLHKVAVEKTSY
jgi:divalent metal cation (Fe/Co/Zn/Cd) transporter